jgi:lipopolysaccharide export LptBFGC system permease protein LptF
MSAWEKFVHYHNQLSDKNFIWFPFMFLKPRPEQQITQGRIIKMTFCFSVYGCLALFIRQLLNQQVNYTSYLYIPVAFFLWFELVTSRLWNIRARSLSR